MTGEQRLLDGWTYLSGINMWVTTMHIPLEYYWKMMMIVVEWWLAMGDVESVCIDLIASSRGWSHRRVCLYVFHDSKEEEHESCQNNKFGDGRGGRYYFGAQQRERSSPVIIGIHIPLYPAIYVHIDSTREVICSTFLVWHKVRDILGSSQETSDARTRKVHTCYTIRRCQYSCRQQIC